MDLLTSVWCGCAGDIVVDFDSLILVAGTHTHTHRFNGPFSGTTRSAGTRKVNQSGFYWSKRQ